MNETFIINLMAAWLDDCRVFSITISTTVFIYSILIFLYTSCYVLFYKDPYEAPSSISSGTAFYISHMQLKTAMETIPGPIGGLLFVLFNHFLLGLQLFLFLNILKRRRHFYQK